MRVRTGRFLRWATPLPSRAQMVVFLRGALVQKKDVTTARASTAPRRARSNREDYAEQKLALAVSNNAGVKSRKYVSHQWLIACGALGGTRTPTILLTATSRQRVYQFRHARF